MEAVRAQYENTDQWMKAPNGEPTKLNEKQWLQVRTPNFKRWFGNWNYDPNKKVETVQLNLKDVEFDHNNADSVKGWLEENLLNETVFVESSGAKVKFFGKSTKASLKRHGEIQRSAYKVLKELIAKSELFDFVVKDEQEKHDKLLGQDIYYAALNVDDKYYSVMFRFNVSGKYFTDAYKDHKITEIKIAPLPYHKSNAYADTSAINTYTISELNGDVKPKTSKVLDENGEPLVVYHGTDADFNVFDASKSRANMDIQGNFFSPWDIDAQGYGPNVRAFYRLTMVNFWRVVNLIVSGHSGK